MTFAPFTCIGNTPIIRWVKDLGTVSLGLVLGLGFSTLLRSTLPAARTSRNIFILCRNRPR